MTVRRERLERTARVLCVPVLAALWFAALAPAPAPAQALRRLHVVALSMRADRARVRIGQVFHVAIHVHVRENVSALDELVIPDVGTLQLLGDERSVTHASGGTDAVETLTLEAAKSGVFTLRGAYLDAIDATTGRPSRFSSNAVRIEVVAPGTGVGRGYGGFAQLVVEVLLCGLVVLAIILGVRALMRLRRARMPVDVAPPAPPAVRPPAEQHGTPRERVAEALRSYRVAPAEPALRQLRDALFTAAGTNGGSTLGDALGATSDRELRMALIAAERAAFGPPHERDAASADLVGAAEGWLR